MCYESFRLDHRDTTQDAVLFETITEIRRQSCTSSVLSNGTVVSFRKTLIACTARICENARLAFFV
jgi:hypothetical protein